MTQGRFIAVVGPSGVGKDSVMAALSARLPGLTLVRRVITRPGDAGGEDFAGVDQATFDRMAAQGDFALSWQAHGLSYGIPASVDQTLARGADVLANLSRGMLQEARARFARFDTLALTASPQVLAQRLTDRDREDSADIARRLKRADFALPSGIEAIRIDNSGALHDTVDRAIAALYPVKV